MSVLLLLLTVSVKLNAQSPEWDWAIAIGDAGYSGGNAITHDASDFYAF